MPAANQESPTAENDRPDHVNQDVRSERVNPRPLQWALLTTATYLVAEVIGGLWTNSLALLADAGHMATDVAALALALLAIWFARRPATRHRTFGFYRAEVLAALLNAIVLIGVSGYIFWEAFQRVGDPPEVDALPMMLIAVGGLIVNAVSAWILARGGGHEQNLNTRGAFLHVIGDMLGSAGAIVAALIMLVTDWYLADPLLSAGIGMLVLWSAWRLLIESVDVLMEASPKDIDVETVRQLLFTVPDVIDSHDLHVWTVTSGYIAMSGHLVVAGRRPWNDVLLDCSTRLREQFTITHITLQPEHVSGQDVGARGSSGEPPHDERVCIETGLPTKGDTAPHYDR